MTHHYYHHSHYITHGQSMNSFEWPNKATKMVRGGSFFLQILSRNKSHREIGGVAKTKPCPSFWQRPLYNRLNCQHLSSTSPSYFIPSSTSLSIYPSSLTSTSPSSFTSSSTSPSINPSPSSSPSSSASQILRQHHLHHHFHHL